MGYGNDNSMLRIKYIPLPRTVRHNAIRVRTYTHTHTRTHRSTETNGVTGYFLKNTPRRCSSSYPEDTRKNQRGK